MLEEVASVAALFVVLTAALTWPQVPHVSTHVAAHFDPLFSIWRLAWVAHQLPDAPLDLFDANIFYPEKATLTYSDAILLLGVAAAPAFWTDANPILVYNLLVLLAFVTAGPAMYLLARELGCSKAGALVGAVAFTFQPYRFAHYAHVELLWSCWIPLALWAFHRLLASARPKYGVLLALFVALQTWSCLYYGVFLVTGLAVLAPVLLAGRPRDELRRLMPAAAAAAMAAAIFIGPYALPYLSSERTVGDRTIGDLIRWSPPLQGYLSAQPGNWIHSGPREGVEPMEGVLFPGVVATALALAALALRPSRVVFAYALLVLVTFDLSLGINGLLYRWFYDFVWPYDGLRVPARMFVVLSAGLAVLASTGWTRLAATAMFAGRRRAAAMAGAALAAAAALESASMPIGLWQVPATPRAYAWLRQQPRAPVFEWPVPLAQDLGQGNDWQYMYYSRAHWQPLANGYSGHFPDSYIRLLNGVRGFPGREAIEYLRNRGVRYLILHSEPQPKRYAEAVAVLAGEPLVREQFVENAGHEELTVYLIEPAARE